jgi:hypothetical protein
VISRRLRFCDLVALNIVRNRVTLGLWVKHRGFPPGQLTGPNSRTWSEDEVRDWLNRRPTAPKPSPKNRRGRSRKTAPKRSHEPVVGVAPAASDQAAARHQRGREEDIAADEVELGNIKIVLVPVSADKAADDAPYSAKMCAQDVDLIRDLDLNPKRERRRVKKRPPVPRFVLPTMARPRERRSAPRRADGARADSGDDGGGGDGPPAPSRSSSLAGRER